jgi:hypothetical protein
MTHVESITKAELLENIRDERMQLESALALLSPDQMLKKGAEDEWTIKDVLVHIIVWEKRMVAWMELALAGEIPQEFLDGFDDEDIDRWNAQTYQANRERFLEDVLEDFRNSYSQALNFVETTDETDLVDPKRFPWRNGRPLWMMVAANTWWHYRMHRETIEDWLEKGSNRKRFSVI